MDVETSGLSAMVQELVSKKKHDTAISAIQIFHAEAPNDPELLNMLGSVAYQGGRFEIALGAAKLLMKNGNLGGAIETNAARCLYHLRRAPEAIEIARTLKDRDPKDPNHAISLALFLKAVDQFDESRRLLNEISENVHGYASLLGWHLLREGEFANGYTVLEKELGIYRAEQHAQLPKEKRLRSDCALNWKTVLLALEGGFGDEIAFLRFAQTLKARGARPLIGASFRLANAFARARDVQYAHQLTGIAQHNYDYYISAMSIIPEYGIHGPANGIAFPYLVSDPEHVKKARQHIDDAAKGRMKIGLAWQGNPEFEHIEFKSLPLELLGPLGQHGQLFSLQRGVSEIPEGAVNLEDRDADWDDTLADIANMDVVVSADTSIAHASGALGISTLLLVNNAPHAYWAKPGETTDWYPSMRVFRQPQYNDWSGAIAKASHYLQKLAERHAS